MTRILILNGPPRCGKDTGAEAIEDYFGDDICKHLKLSQPLKDITARVAGLPQAILEKDKDVAIPHLGISYRDGQIHTYNQLSAVFGPSWLGRCFVNELEGLEQPYIVLSDGGRNDDITPILRHYSPADLMIVQIMRENCSFMGDIRSYISAPRVRTRPIINRDLEEFKAELIDFAAEFFA